MTVTDAPSDAEAAAREPSPYERLGGEPVLRRLVERFYDEMDTAPEAAGIRAMHAADLGPMRQRLFEFLSTWLGGPQIYRPKPGGPCIMSAHRAFAIGAAERDAWMLCMRRAMDDCDLEPDFRAALDQALLRLAEAFRNR